jgi:hypothetical protein
MKVYLTTITSIKIPTTPNIIYRYQDHHDTSVYITNTCQAEVELMEIDCKIQNSLEDVLVIMGVVHSAGTMDSSNSLEYNGTQWSLSTLKNLNDISPATQKHLQKVHDR